MEVTMENARFLSEKNSFEVDILAPNGDKKYIVTLDKKEGKLTLLDAQTQEKTATTKLSSYFTDKYADLTAEQLAITETALQKMKILAKQHIESAQKDIFYDVKGSENSPNVSLKIIPEHLSGLDSSDPNDVHSLSADEIVADQASVAYNDKETGQNLQIDFIFNDDNTRTVANVYRQKDNKEKELLVSFCQHDYLDDARGVSLAYIKNVLPHKDWENLGNIAWGEAKKMEKIVQKASQDVVSAVHKIEPSLNKRDENFVTLSRIEGYHKTVIDAQKQRAQDHEKDILLRPKTGLLDQITHVKLNYEENEYTQMTGEPNVISAEVLFQDKGGNIAFGKEFLVKIAYHNKNGENKLVADIYSQSNVRSNKLGKLLGNSVRNLSRKHLGSAEAHLSKNMDNSNTDSLPMEDFEKLLQQTKFKSDVHAIQQIVGFARKQVLAELPSFTQQYEQQKGLQQSLEIEKQFDKQNKNTSGTKSSRRQSKISR